MNTTNNHSFEREVLIISNFVKRLFSIVAITGATLAAPSCGKTIEPPQPHHDTVYVWGFHNWDEIWPADKVAASADSVLVDHVYLKNDGVSLAGLDVTLIQNNMQAVLNTVSEQNRHKLHGMGTLKRVYITDKNDSTWLSQFGFKFIEPRYHKQ